MSDGVELKFRRKRAQSIKKTLDKISYDMNYDIIDETKNALLLLHSSAVKIIQKKSPGTTETRYNHKRTVTASREGESPNTDMGRLVSSIGFNFQLGSRGGAVGVVGTNLLYGKYLELGTSKMKPRPWLSTAWTQNYEMLKKNYSTSLIATAKKSGI